MLGPGMGLMALGAASLIVAATNHKADFFLSSRRRHTRWTGDWSSDVCSSDLLAADQRLAGDPVRLVRLQPATGAASAERGRAPLGKEIGRASCRERV